MQRVQEEIKSSNITKKTRRVWSVAVSCGASGRSSKSTSRRRSRRRSHEWYFDWMVFEVNSLAFNVKRLEIVTRTSEEKIKNK